MQIFLFFGPDALDVDVRVDVDVCTGEWETVIDTGVRSMSQQTRICNVQSWDSSRVTFATLMTSGTLRVGWSLATCAAFLTMAFSSNSSLGMLRVG